MDNWKILVRYTFPQEAYVAKSVLESEGLLVVLKDELTVQTDNFMSNAIGGVKIMIRESDFEKGFELLKRGGFIQEVEQQKMHIERLQLTSEMNQGVCPFCESDNVVKKRDTLTYSSLFFLVFGFLLPAFKTSYYICFDCDKKWKYKK